jgi:hypothetical protein
MKQFRFRLLLESAKKKANGSSYLEPLAVFTIAEAESPRGRRTGRGLELKFQPPLDYSRLSELEQSAADTDAIGANCSGRSSAD